MSDEIRYIKEHEIDGDVKPFFLKIIDRFISCIGSVVKIHNFTQGTHSKNSAHYQGLAGDMSKVRLDIMRVPSDSDIAFMTDKFKELVMKPDKDLFEQAIIAKLCGAEGIGIYPYWGKPGLHLDAERSNRRPLAWIGVDVRTCESRLEDAKEKNQSNVYFYLI